MIKLAFAQIAVHLVFFRSNATRAAGPPRTDIGIMLLLRLAMIQTEPVMTRKNDQHAPA